MKRLLELAVTNVHRKCNESWYCQRDGLAMGASLAVVSANLWMKSWEPQLKLQTSNRKTNTQSNTCRNCEHRVTARSRGVECKVCKSVTQNMIAWKTSSGGAHSFVKMIRLTLTIRPKLKFF